MDQPKTNTPQSQIDEAFRLAPLFLRDPIPTMRLFAAALVEIERRDQSMRQLVEMLTEDNMRDAGIRKSVDVLLATGCYEPPKEIFVDDRRYVLTAQSGS